MSAHRRFNIPLHSNDALKTMNDLRRKGELCDVVLHVDGRQFPAHRIVLAGASSYLRAMFTNGMLESGMKDIKLQGVEASVMESLLDFAYTGNIDVTVENVQALLSSASMLNLQSLRHVCCGFLQTHLDSSNCLGIRAFADLYSCSDLEETAYRFVRQHFLDVVKGDEFLQLPKQELRNLLREDLLQVRSESQVFEAVETWILHDFSRRKDHAVELLSNVRLPLLTLEFLEARVFPSKVVKNNADCQLLLAKVLNESARNLPLYMTIPRAQPQAVYVIGGRNGVDCQLASLERYDTLTDEWTVLQSMKYPRTAVGACSLNGLLYVVGGECAVNIPHDDTMYVRHVECYDPAVNQWMSLADIAIQRSFVAVTALNGYLYALGGEDRTCSYNYVERYDPKTDQWSTVQCMRRKRSGAGVAVCDGKLYIAGGYDRGVHSDRASVECYDPETDTWTFVTELEKARSGMGLVSVNGCLYALGGRNRSTDHYFDLAERYNPQLQQWQPIAPLNTPRAWPSVAVYDSKIFVLGGFDGAHRLASVEVYNPDTDVWHFVQDMNTCRAGCGAAVL